MKSMSKLLFALLLLLTFPVNAEVFVLTHAGDDPLVFHRFVGTGEICVEADRRVRVKMFHNRQRVVYAYQNGGEGYCYNLRVGLHRVYVRAEEGRTTVVVSEYLKTFDSEVIDFLRRR